MISCYETPSIVWFKTGNSHEEYLLNLDDSVSQNGKKSICLESKTSSPKEFGAIMQSCSTKEFLGKKIKMKGYIKTENVSNWSGMWLRINPIKSCASPYFDNMKKRPIKGSTNWTEYEITLDVPENSNSMNFGVLLHGTGKVWLDNLSFEILENSTERFDSLLSVGNSNHILLKPTNLNFED